MSEPTTPPTPLSSDPSAPESARRAIEAASAHVPPFDAAAGLVRLEGALRVPAASASLGSGATLAAVGTVVVLLGIGGLVASGLGILEPESTVGPEARASGLEAPAVDRAPSASPEPAASSAPVAPSSEPPAEGAVALPTPTRGAAAPSAGLVPPSAAPTADDRASDRVDRGAEARGRSTAERTAPGPGTEPDHSGDVALEIRLVGEARGLVSDDPGAALERLERLDREVDGGFLSVERSGLRALALAGLGRDAEARRAGDAFLARHPDGALSDRVRRAMESGPE